MPKYDIDVQLPNAWRLKVLTFSQHQRCFLSGNAVFFASTLLNGWKATGHCKIFLSSLKLAVNGRDDATDDGLLSSLSAPVSPIWFLDK
jgi:hypothetical protein